MSSYASNDDVQPVRVTTYKHLRKASRRGWAMPTGAEPSLADLVIDEHHRNVLRTDGSLRSDAAPRGAAGRH